MVELEVFEIAIDHIEIRSRQEGCRYKFGVVATHGGKRRLSDTAKVWTNNDAEEASEALFASAYALARDAMAEAGNIDA